MKITFLGTRGYIDLKKRTHRRHTATLVSYKNTHILIDWGLDWLGKLDQLIPVPDAILITHGHPDHAWGLQHGALCPVYASEATWKLIDKYPIAQRHVAKPRVRFKIGPFTCEAFFVIHSLRAPAVGYRISAGGKTIFCAHDIISIPERHEALHNVDLYIGDGASITRPIIRRKGNKLFGHTTIRAQIGWCQKEKVPRTYFTHCGSQIVGGDERILGPEVKALGKERGVDARIAHDGLQINV
jgi:phosphoribosyl 1,2-cyclic phosphodiesterase